ncbi:ribosome maturation factor RimM [Alcanivorax sp. 1008]|uniref:ribosome maturation factor RimM n=1 Tax=Alcanivorax sp. 1008 TaxID=2816853 RepID=UPI001DC80AC9|nr:ribosome maturation factor RimM [Alcanivorax sp. 1008]MCC1497268.1 ribosome maturation factor RimM [Alcanivorax sp. 1008]
MATATELLLVGRIGAAHGIKGWVKLNSFTDPLDNILHYQPWTLRGPDGDRTVKVTGSRMQGKGLVVQLEGESDRTRAEALFCGREVLVPASALPVLEDDEFYWRDLIGLRVCHKDGRDLGKLTSMMETGANDVLVVRGDGSSIDTRERLIPWLPDDVVLNVDTAAGVITVDWDTEF